MVLCVQRISGTYRRNRRGKHPVGHKHGTIFKAPESLVKALLEEKK